MAFERSLGALLEAILEAFWGHLGGILGPGPREEAPRGPEEAATHPRRGKRPPSDRQEMRVLKVQKCAQERSKTTSETKMTKILKITFFLMKRLDFEGSEGPKIVQNGPEGFKIHYFQNITCKAAAESIFEAFGAGTGRDIPG